METLVQLFGSMMTLVYHCFDRMVINGYLSTLSRPEQVVYFFKYVLAQQCITKEVLSARTKHYSCWVDSIREEPPHSDRMGASRRSQGRLRAALPQETGAEEPLWRLFHLEKHGTGPHLPISGAEIPNE